MAQFCWQGLRIEHPDDWAPVVLSGTRKEGYVRLAGTGTTGCQLRWQIAASGSDLDKVLNRYLGRLRADAKRAKLAIQCEQRPEGSALVYRWAAKEQGRGVLLFDEISLRTVFLEVFGSRKEQLLPQFLQIRESLGPSVEAGRERWELYGLALSVPPGLQVLSKKLEAGRTTLEMGTRRIWLHAQRWSFAEQLIQKHGLESWTLGLLGKRARTLTADLDAGRVAARYPQGPIRTRIALVQHQPERNQIVVLRTRHRGESSMMPWDWIA